jgi:hypothetical protein
MIKTDFELGLGVTVFAGDCQCAFALGSSWDIERLEGARIPYGHCVRWGSLPHPAGKAVAMYFGQPDCQ